MSENQNETGDDPLLSAGKILVAASPGADGQKSGPDGPGAEDLQVSTKQQILCKLDRMPGLIATGLLTTARANSMRSVYQTILANLNDAAPGGAAAIADDDLLAVLRSQPDLLKVFKPFLTPEQLNLIVREAAND